MPAADSPVHPAAAAELDGDAASRAAGPAGRAGTHGSRESARTRAGTGRARRPSLPAAASGSSASRWSCQTFSMAARREVPGVDVALAARLVRERGTEPVRQALGDGRVVGQDREGLDIEHEAGRRARHPELAVARRRRRVVRGIDLHDLELVRVVAQTRFGAGHPGWVEAPGGDECGVGPGAAADEDASWHRALRSRSLRGPETLYHFGTPAYTPARSSVGATVSADHSLVLLEADEGGAADGRAAERRPAHRHEHTSPGLALTARLGTAYNRGPSVSEWRNW